MLFSFIPSSQAELWELLVEINVEEETVNSGDKVGITGRVVDHAYQPVAGAEIFLRMGSETVKRFTHPDGEFRGEFRELERTPGTYIVNVIATLDGKTGLANTQFEVNGNTTSISRLQEKLSTDEAIFYLNAKETDFEKNPIGQTLFKYYQEISEELIKEVKMNEPNADQIFVEEQRIIAENLKNEAIAKYNPGAGIYSGQMLDYYINGLDSGIRELVSKQMNFTANNFIEAQNIKNEIIANGGTYEEARKAYLEKIAISKETLEQFNQEQSEENVEEPQAEETQSND